MKCKPHKWEPVHIDMDGLDVKGKYCQIEIFYCIHCGLVCSKHEYFVPTVIKRKYFRHDHIPTGKG